MAWCVLISISIFIRCQFVKSFLLDTPQTIGGSSSSGQYVTLTKFMEEMKLQEQEITIQRQVTDKLRHDMDNSLALLVSQMKDYFSSLEQKMVDERKLNETKEILLLLQLKYQKLEHNHDQLKTEFTALQQKYSILTSKYNVLENKSSQNDQHIDQSLESFKNSSNAKQDAQSQDISVIKNITDQLTKNVTALVHLPNIKPLHEIDFLKQSLEALSKRTDTLTMKEEARSQDFLALYNMAVETKSSFFDFRSKVNHVFSKMSANQRKTFTELKQNQTFEISRLERTLEKQQNESELRVNETFEQLQDAIKNSTEKVAMTAFVNGADMYDLPARTIVKFADVQFSEGMDHVSQYISSGKFRCEKRGLYLVSATLETSYNDAEFHMYVRNRLYTKNFKYDSSGWWHSTSATIIIDLQPGDTVWIQISDTKNSVRGDRHSRFSIIKVK